MSLFLALRVRISVAAVLLVLGLFLAVTKVDRQLLDLPPSEGAAASVTLSSQSTYSQTFVFTRKSLSKLGFYFSTSNPANKNIMIAVFRGEQKIGEAFLPTIFISSSGASDVTFSPPLATIPGETLKAVIMVPPELSKIIRIQTRLNDGTFDAKHTVFSINDVAQGSALAYQAYFSYRLPFAIQFGGLCLFAALLLIAFPTSQFQKNIWLILYACTASFLYVIPSFALGGHPFLLVLSQAVALLGMIILLRQLGLSFLASLFGAHVFAFTTWWPLQFLSGRQYYLLVCLLPVLIVLATYWRSLALLWKIVLSAGVVITIASFLLFAHQAPAYKLLPVPASARDIFLDPNQLPSSEKLYPDRQKPAQSEAWDNFGSYVSIPVALFALLGLITSWRTLMPYLVLGVVIVLTSLIPWTVALLFPLLPIHSQHLIIILTFIVALFAGEGFEKLFFFLGSKDKLVQGMMAVVIFISLLDLWNVASGSLEYMLLIQ